MAQNQQLFNRPSLSYCAVQAGIANDTYRFSDGGRRGQASIFFESVLAKKVRTDPDARCHWFDFS